VADRGIKKVIIPKSSLPSVNGLNQHIVRFRIVSEDRNRFSEWSQKFLVDGSTVSEIESEHIPGRVFTIVWNDPERRAAYDIFVKIDSDDYVYHGSSTSTTYSFINEATSTIRYAIQIQGIDKVFNQALKIYESESISS
jgi:hypothetical protein